MTLHAHLDYECKKCGLHYIPIKSAPKCPLCGASPERVYIGFTNLFFKSASFNLEEYFSFIPPAWGVFTVSDNYFLAGFQLLQSMYLERIYSLTEPHEKSLEDLLSYKMKLEDVLKGPFLKEKCIDIAEDMRRKTLEKIKDERHKALAEHISIFLKEICEEINKKVRT